MQLSCNYRAIHRSIEKKELYNRIEAVYYRFEAVYYRFVVSWQQEVFSVISLQRNMIFDRIRKKSKMTDEFEKFLKFF